MLNVRYVLFCVIHVLVCVCCFYRPFGHGPFKLDPVCFVCIF